MAPGSSKPRTVRTEDGRWAVKVGRQLVGVYASRETAWRVAGRITDWQERSGGK